jgi:hypothetical protein
VLAHVAVFVTPTPIAVDYPRRAHVAIGVLLAVTLTDTQLADAFGRRGEAAPKDWATPAFCGCLGMPEPA